MEDLCWLEQNSLSADFQYLRLLYLAYFDGYTLETRNSVCRRTIAHQCSFSEAPLVSVRKTAWKYALREMEWFLSGSNNIKDLHPSVHHWWKPWANKWGVLPNQYGKQFRRAWGVVDSDGNTLNVIEEDARCLDQIQYLIDGIKNHPNSRRNLLTTWNAAEMADPSTEPTACHNTVTQAFVTDNRLTLVTYQRSADLLCGLPANWIQEWALLLWLAHRTGREVGRLVWIGGDCHLYKQHWPLTEKLLDRKYKLEQPPDLIYEPTSEDFKADDFRLSGEYKPLFTDTAEMVV